MDSSRHDRAADGRPVQPTPAEGAAPALPRGAGLAKTAAGDFKPVLHLASIAQALARVMPAPYSRARAVVLERLHAEVVALFIAPGDELGETRLLLAADDWRPELANGVESLAERQRNQAAVLHPSGAGANMDPAEALWRGVPLLHDDPDAGAWIADDERRALPALPALGGRAGALEAWRVAGVPGADRAGVEFVRQALALGMFELDAERLFPEVYPRSFWDSAPAPVQPATAPAHHLPLSFPLLQHVQASAAAAPADGQQSHAAPALAGGLHLVRPPSDAAKERAGAVAALKPPQGFTKGGGWTDASRAELQRQYESLRTAGLTYEGAMIELHKAWGYSKKSDKSGGPLAKVLTKANQGASRNGKRRQLAG
jgi:hypothetical protein